MSHLDEIIKMSIRDLADATYTSPATILRLCRKTGMDGYAEFKIKFHAEIKDQVRNSKDINENLPFQYEDSFHHIANIDMRGIQETLDM